MHHLFFLICVAVTLQPSSSYGSEECVPLNASYCPTYCDSTGEIKRSQCCKAPPLCCNIDDNLECCNQPENQVESVVSDGWNCRYEDERTPMEVLTTALIWLSAFVGVVAILATITVFTAHKVKRKRIQRRRSPTGSSYASDITDAPIGTSNPVDSIILHPIMASPPPYSLTDTGGYPGGTIPSEDPPTYEEIIYTSEA